MFCKTNKGCSFGYSYFGYSTHVNLWSIEGFVFVFMSSSHLNCRKRIKWAPNPVSTLLVVKAQKE